MEYEKSCVGKVRKLNPRPEMRNPRISAMNFSPDPRPPAPPAPRIVDAGLAHLTCNRDSVSEYND